MNFQSVLFSCVANSARSQMSEGLAKKRFQYSIPEHPTEAWQQRFSQQIDVFAKPRGALQWWSAGGAGLDVVEATR